MSENKAVQIATLFFGAWIIYALFLIFNMLTQGPLSNLDNPKTLAQAKMEAASKAVSNSFRIAPVGKTKLLSDQPAALVAKMPVIAPVQKSGKDIYSSTCSACHGTGILGAPKSGDKAAWETRLTAGMDALVASAIKGKGAMPPKGGNAALSDSEIKSTIEFMAKIEATPSVKAETPEKQTTAEKPIAKKAKVDLVKGEKIYSTTCSACHGTGILGAPKKGDIAAWEARLSDGMDALVASAIKGKGAMPPKGGNAALSDVDILAAIAFMKQ